MIEVRNSWHPPKHEFEDGIDVNALLDPDRPFDVNFCLPIQLLETSKVRLVPFVPALHNETWQTRTLAHPEVWKYIGYGPFLSPSEAAIWFEQNVRADSNSIWFAIIDKSKPSERSFGGAFAGVVGLLHTSRENACTEIGHIMILPESQRTHVTTHAVCLLLRYLLELPVASSENTPAHPGLGLRRVEWRTNADNERSLMAAGRVGFKREGTMRWHRVLPEDKDGEQSRPGDPWKAPGRHSALLAFCWDDWENGGRHRVEELMS